MQATPYGLGVGSTGMRLQKWRVSHYMYREQPVNHMIADIPVADDLNTIVDIIAHDCKIDHTDVVERLKEVVDIHGAVVGQEFVTKGVRYLAKRE